MKLYCTVEIYVRNLLSRKKLRSATLAFFKKSDKENDVCLYLQTRKDNQGTKYQIAGNIERVFKKFIAEGKATIRLTQPCHDIIIQSNAIHLKSFFHVLEHLSAFNFIYNCQLINRHAIPSITSLSSEFFWLEQNIIVIKKKSEYPTLHGFPKTTEQLFLSGLDRRSFDQQILRLQNLRTLVLSNNKISSLPEELGTLPHLQELDVSQNFLGRSAQSRWAWIEQSAVKNNLRLLDISNNSLTKLPTQIGDLQGLVLLKIRQNLLTHLPESIGTLRHLRNLDVANNSLLYLPATIAHLGWEFIDISEIDQFRDISNINRIFIYLDISENPFPHPDNYDSDSDDYDPAYKLSEVNVDMRRGIPSLAELSAKCVIKSRLTYASLIPLPLVEYLDEAKYCWICRNACFDRYIRKIVTKEYMNYIPIILPIIYNDNHYTVINGLRAKERGTYCVEYYFCSLKCYNQSRLAER